MRDKLLVITLLLLWIWHVRCRCLLSNPLHWPLHPLFPNHLLAKKRKKNSHPPLVWSDLIMALQNPRLEKTFTLNLFLRADVQMKQAYAGRWAVSQKRIMIPLMPVVISLHHMMTQSGVGYIITNRQHKKPFQGKDLWLTAHMFLNQKYAA